MKRKSKLAGLLSAFLLVGAEAFWIQIMLFNEPVYHNRPLKSWLASLGYGDDNDRAASEKVLRELYRSDLPNWLRYTSSWLEVRLRVCLSISLDMKN